MAMLPRLLLGRLSAALAILAWAMSLIFIWFSGTTLQVLAADTPMGDDTLASGAAPLQLGLTVQMLNSAMEGWAVAIGAFGVFAAGALAALLSLESGRRAMRRGAVPASAAAGTTAGGLYILCLLAVLILPG